VTEAVPIIYRRQFGPRRVAPMWRMAAVLIAAACLAVLMTAILLEPSRQGVGTHTRLGLAHCEFLARTSLPCPTCGMTTSFAHFVRGNLLASLYVQPMGTVLALGTAVAFWVALYIGVTGQPVLRLLRQIDGVYYVIPLVTMALLAWGWKMLLQIRGVDGW
jgi:hypothetical protein